MAQDLKDLSTYHISANISEYEPARTGFFSFVVEDIDSLLRADFNLGTPTSKDYITKGQDVIRLSVTKATIPTFTVEPIKIRRGNSEVNFASVPSFGAGSITVEDFVGVGTKSVLLAWQALVYDVNKDAGGRAGNWTDANGVAHQGYKKNCKLYEYDQNHTLIRYWDLIGCFITGLDQSAGFDKESDDKVSITVNIVYDRAIPHQVLKEDNK